jgi:hypothetical protein
MENRCVGCSSILKDKCPSDCARDDGVNSGFQTARLATTPTLEKGSEGIYFIRLEVFDISLSYT